VSLKSIKLLFLYDDNTNQKNIIKFLTSECSSVAEEHSLDLNSIDFTKTDIILIKELGDEAVLQTFATTIKLKYKTPIIVIEKKENIEKFSDELKNQVDAFVSLPIDKNTFMGILTANAKKVHDDKHDSDALLQSVMVLQKNMFFLAKNDHIIFESPELQALASKDELSQLYTDRHSYELFSFASQQNREFEITEASSTHELYDTLITLHDVVPQVAEKQSPLLSKEAFYGYIKNRLLSLEFAEQFALCNIQIVNHSELELSHGKAKVLESLHELMHHIVSIVGESKISFWHQTSFVLTLDEDFETAKETVSRLQKAISDDPACSELSLKIIVSTTPVNAKDTLDDCLDKIEALCSVTDNSLESIYVASSYDDIDDDNKKVIAMLHDVLDGSAGATTLSLTNFYKGLVIYNKIGAAGINKDGVLTIKTEVIQCLAMSIEQTVLLHAPLIPNDISCQVKQVNSRQKIAQLENFEILNTSYSQRKFSRLQPGKNTPVTLIIDKITITGKVLDVSMNSISVYVTNSLMQNYKRDTLLIASMNLVLTELGHSESVRINSRIINLFTENDGYKVILGLESNDAHTIEMLGEYLRHRKKELIGELRNLLKVT
jgi:hypothetical protein